MENKDYVENKGKEIKKDRGDDLKKDVKPKVHKKDMKLIKDRGDSAPKAVSEKIIYLKKNKYIESLNTKDYTKVTDDITSVQKRKNIEAEISKNADKNLYFKSKSPEWNETIIRSSHKSGSKLGSYRYSELKLVKDNFIIKHSKQSDPITKSLRKTDIRNTKENNNIKYFQKNANTTDFAPKTITIKKNITEFKHNEVAVTNSFDKIVPETTHQNKDVSNTSDKPAPSPTMNKTFERKSIKDNVLSNNFNHIETIKKSLVDKTTSRYTEKNEEISKFTRNPDMVSDRNLIFNTIKVNDNHNKPTRRYESDKFSPKNSKLTESIIKNLENPYPVVDNNVVENKKRVHGLLNIDEKEQIKEKYSFKLKSAGKVSQIKDRDDILKMPNNLEENKENTSENSKFEESKSDFSPESAVKSRKYPVIRTVVAKNDVTRVYKAVTFAEQKRRKNTSLQIKIPLASDTVKAKTKSPILPPMLPNNNENCVINTKIPNMLSDDNNGINMTKQTRRDILDKLVRNNNNFKKNVNNLQQNEDNFVRHKNSPKMSPNMPLSPNVNNLRNVNAACKRDDVSKSVKLPTNILSKYNKKRSKEIPNMSRSTESRSSGKTKLCKKGNRNRLTSDLSLFSFGTGRGSPLTEVAKWAPSSINKHTQPYYEAWIDTTLAAISKFTDKDKLYYESQNLVKSFKRILEQQRENPELVNDTLDECYVGKIKIKQKD